MAETTYIKAITATLAAAMRADERVFVLGEDVAEGGPYTATAGLAEEFGTERVINTPISEAAITGVAIGAAQSGLRPVLEIMFIDFITLALDQLVNAAAKAHFMSGGQLTVPLVLRTQGGAGHRGAAQHSQSLESWLTHVPGPQGRDAEPRGRRRRPARQRDRRPEPRRVHREQDAVLPQGGRARARPRRCRSARPPPSARAATSRSSPSRGWSTRRSRRRSASREDGIEAEVIDPRTLVPLDLDAIVESVERTGRLVVAHEAVEHGGFGAEIAAQVQHAAFDFLDAPIERVGAPFAPIPFSPPLEDAYLPGADEIVGGRAGDIVRHSRRGRSIWLPEIEEARCTTT